MRSCQLLTCAALSFLPIACNRASGDEETTPIPPFVLSADELNLARELAEKGLNLSPAPTSLNDRVYYIKTDLLPKDTTRQVMVIHYRYQGDETIFTHVDLTTREVLGREKAAHYPTALAAEETRRALDLARQDQRVAPLFEAGAIAGDFRPIQAVRGDALFGRRVCQVMLKRDGGYLTTPVVLVDLSTETVILKD